MLKESSLEEHNASPAITGINDTNTNIPVRSPVQGGIAVVQEYLGILHLTHTDKWESQHITANCTVWSDEDKYRANSIQYHVIYKLVMSVIKHQDSQFYPTHPKSTMIWVQWRGVLNSWLSLQSSQPRNISPPNQTWWFPICCHRQLELVNTILEYRVFILNIQLSFYTQTHKEKPG